MKSLLLLMLVLAVCWASKPITFYDVSPKNDQEILDDYKLPDNVIPTSYEIELSPIFESDKEEESFTFKGKSIIQLEILKDTYTITFHAHEELNITNIILTIPSEPKPKDLKPKLSFVPQKDFVILTFDEPLKNEEGLATIATLTLEYTGKLNDDDLRGFYRSSYQDKKKKKWLATTHFEPVGARRAFPCWDEPHIKSFFTISIKPPNGYEVISNMNGKKDQNTWTFNKTPKMSTYLVAFVVSDFQSIEKKKNSNFKVWAKPTVQKDSMNFALEYGLKTLDELSNYTNYNYSETMTKMDQIAIPDFAAGAMENWGLVTYKEPRLLYIDGQNTTEDKQSIATVIAHEFAHQWFGNLVTCKKWNYVWLNEGFATFFQYYISDKVVSKLAEEKKDKDKDKDDKDKYDKDKDDKDKDDKDKDDKDKDDKDKDDKEEKEEDTWRLMEQFVIRNVQASSFVVDADNKTRALNPQNSIQTPAQISSLFDDIAYKKGASILYMMYGFLSEDVFQQGLQKYLNDHKFDSVDSNDFFTSVENSDKDIKNILPKDKKLEDVMDNWVNKPGYPVITVQWEKEKEKTGNKLTITQERFFLEKPVKKDETKWYIPINYIVFNKDKDGKNKRSDNFEWMTPDNESKIITLNKEEIEAKSILFNTDQTGYYRVNYDDTLWELLVKYLNTKDYKDISAINRAQLIDDALNLARAGFSSYSKGLSITTYLTREVDYIPWYAAARAFNYLDSVLRGGKNYAAYHKYVAELIEPFSSKVNYNDAENGTHVDKLAKVLALNTACQYGEKKCVKFVVAEFQNWLNEKNNKLPLDLRRGILCAALRNADEKTWDATLEKYDNIEDEDIKADVLAGLGCASNRNAEKFLNKTLEKKPVVGIFAAMNSINAGNAESFGILVKFITNNIEKIREVDKDNSLLTLLNNLSHKVVTIEQYAEISLLIHKQVQDLEKVNGLSVAIRNLAWINNYRVEVEKFIVKNCKSCQSKKEEEEDDEPDSASSITVTSILLIISLLFTRFY
ncbi:hypothetical protein PUN28_012807 [Cardiocondyla obscurior]|uniref:Aminopeptidase n=1 Tax=Cardiocondyla obscurior TaxID=286306 RepID=A0AAW2FAA7_9HYME